MSYNHLTLEERTCLALLHEEGMGIRAIAKILSRSPSTISRELKRGKTAAGGYSPYYSYSMAIHRRRQAKKSTLGLDPEKKNYVIEKLQLFWSPETIANRWAMEHPGSKISTSTIYRYIKRGWLPGISRKKHLRRRGKRRVHRNSNYNTIHPQRIIPEWPDEIRNRTRIGDWEGDTVQGARGKGCIATLVDRKSGFLCAWIVHSKEAGPTRQALLRALEGRPVQSLSLDNGAEFAEFLELEKQLNAPIYFAEPHKPWQRGCNENANGLLRFFFPKGYDFTQVSQDELQDVLELINSRPRKRLGWRSPLEIFSVALT